MGKGRRLISIIFVVLLTALVLAPFSDGERTFEDYGELEPVTIYLATDTHFISPSLTDGGTYYSNMIRNGDGKFMPYCSEINEAMIEKVIADRPAAFIVSGDLTFNGARESHQEYAALLGRVEEAGIPVLVIPGNHDLTLKRAAKFSGDSYELVSSIDASEYLDLYVKYGREDSYDFDETSLSYVYELAPNLRVLCVDVNTVAGMSGILTPGTLEFVEEQLKKAAEDHAYVISVTHQTLLVHSELTSQGMSFINSDKLIELYEKYNVVLNLSGHMHIQHIVVSGGGVPDIATGALLTSPNYYGELKISGKKFDYRAVPLEVPAVPDFAEKSHQFLWENAYRQGMEQLVEAGAGAAAESASDVNLPDDAAGELADPATSSAAAGGDTATGAGSAGELAGFFADFNVAYIAGRSDLIPWDDAILKKWEQTESFVPRYFQLVQEEGAQDYTVYEIDLRE